MKRTTMLFLAIFAAAACSSGKEATREDEQAGMQQEAAPQVGILSSVDSSRIMLNNASDADPEPDLFERTQSSVVIRNGSELSWEQLSAGDAVRVFYEPGIFGPDRVARVELLEGEEAEKVRRQVAGDVPPDSQRSPGMGEPMPPSEGAVPPTEEPPSPTPY